MTTDRARRFARRWVVAMVAWVVVYCATEIWWHEGWEFFRVMIVASFWWCYGQVRYHRGYIKGAQR